jgi:hypothetical protein
MRFVVALLLSAGVSAGADDRWIRHVIADDFRTDTAVAADFTGDGKVDVIANCGPRAEDVLFVAPKWGRVIINRGVEAIHSAVLDVDRDGDLDYVAARYMPGLVYWLERPPNPVKGPWKLQVIDEAPKGGVNGIHGLFVGDVNLDRKPDLIANSAQPDGAFPDSLAWFEAPRWERRIFAKGDAPGLSHYFGFGDVNGDGRPDVASAAKTEPGGNWFAWWEAPADPRQTWTKRVIATGQEGATNILIADVNGDRRNDFVASRGHGRGVLWFEAPEWRPHVIDGEIEGPHSLATGDVDRDGDVDAATCGKDSREVAWYENDGRGEFRKHLIQNDQAAYDIRLVDMDGDKDLDLLVSGQESKNVVWFENRVVR